MKKIISLLAVALFATVFAAGCGKVKDCVSAKNKKDCEVTEKEDKSQCTWTPKAGTTSETEGTCAVKAPPATFTASADAVTECAAHNADQTACNLVVQSTKQADAKCEYDANATPNKCKAVKK